MELVQTRYNAFGLAEKLKCVAQTTEITTVLALSGDRTANQFYSFLLGLYTNQSQSSEIKQFTGQQLLELFNRFKHMKVKHLIDYFATNLPKLCQEGTVTELDLRLLEKCQLSLGSKEEISALEIDKFCEMYSNVCLNGPFWQMCLLESSYFALCKQSWIDQPSNNARFGPLWESIFETFVYITKRQLKSKEHEKQKLDATESNYFVHLLQKVVNLKPEYFRDTFYPLCERLFRKLVDFVETSKNLAKSTSPKKNNYFQKACKILGFEFGDRLLDAVEKREEEAQIVVKSTKKIRAQNETKAERETLTGNVNNRQILSKSMMPAVEVKMNSPGSKHRSLAAPNGHNISRRLEPMFQNEIRTNAQKLDHFLKENFPIVSHQKESENGEKRALTEGDFLEESKEQLPHIPNEAELKAKQKAFINDEILKRFRKHKFKIQQAKELQANEEEKALEKFIKMHVRAQTQVEATMQARGHTLAAPSLYSQSLIENDAEFLIKILQPRGAVRKTAKQRKRAQYPNTFNVNAVSALELSAMSNNFILHKNLFSVLFKQYADVHKLDRTEEEGVLPVKASQLDELEINVLKFQELLKTIDSDFADVASQVFVNIFRYVNLGVQQQLKKSTVLNFSGFEMALKQAAYYLYTRELQFRTPLYCFNLFLSKMEKVCNKHEQFQNDFVLNVKADRQLVSYFTKLKRANPEAQLPPNFESLKVLKFTTFDSGLKIEKEPRRIVTSILFDLIMEKVDVQMVVCDINKESVTLVRQKIALAEEVRADCSQCQPQKQKQLADGKVMVGQNESVQFYKNSILDVNEQQNSQRFDKIARSRDLLPKSRQLRAAYKPPDLLSLSLKLAVVSDTKNCRKAVLEAAECLESLLGRVETFKPEDISKIDESGKIVNRFNRAQLFKSLQLQETKKTENGKFEQRRAETRKKVEEYRQKQLNQTAVKEEEFHLNESKRKAELAKQIEQRQKWRNEVLKTQKENELKQKERELQLKIDYLAEEKAKIAKFKSFQTEYYQKILGSVSKRRDMQRLAAESKMSAWAHNPSKIACITKEENEKILKLLSEQNTQKAITETEFKNAVSQVLNNEIWRSYTARNAKRFERIFEIYREQIDGKWEEVKERKEIAEEAPAWTYRQFYKFCRDFQVVPQLLDPTSLKVTYNAVRKLRGESVKFGRQQLSDFVIYASVLRVWKAKELATTAADLEGTVSEAIRKFDRFAQEALKLAQDLYNAYSERIMTTT